MTTYVDIMSHKGRECDIDQLKAQIGYLTLGAICGGRFSIYRDSNNTPIGLFCMTGTNRFIVIVLDWNDTYSVYRYRKIVRGEKRGQWEIEFEARDVYCDKISDVAYEASCWR